MKHDERNFLFPPEELVEQSEWNTHWISYMYDRAQSIAVGVRKEYFFRTAIEIGTSILLSRDNKACPALVFDTKDPFPRMSGYVFAGEILEIHNARFGSVKEVKVLHSTYEILLMSGRKLVVHTEEMAGALWDDESKTWILESPKTDWSMSVRFRILDRDPRKLFVDNPNPSSWFFPHRNDPDPGEQLHEAVKQGNLTLLRDLLDSGTNIHARTGNGDTPLFLAARSGNREAAEMLLQYGANPSIQNRIGWSSLHTAAVQGYMELVQLLLDHGAYVDPRTKQGWTPLFLTASSGHVDIAKLLLDAGADVYAEDVEEKIPLHNARKNGYQEIVKLLKDAMGLQY